MEWYTLFIIGCAVYAVTHGTECEQGTCGEKEIDVNLGHLEKASSAELPNIELPEQTSNRVKRQVCAPNSSFQNNCNVCKCDSEGASFSCTHNECMERDANRDVEVFMESEGIDHIERESVCHSRATFQINCNTCICNADGTDYRCTNNVCPLPADVELFKELKDETHVVPLKKKKCEPNEDFRDGCNKCRCDGDGTSYVCSVTPCKDTRYPKKEGKSAQNLTVVCKPNEAFRKECNTCWCNDDGTSYFCTRKVCVPSLDDNVDQPEEVRVIERECRPREVFELDCNTCRCNEDGKSFSCTGRGCVVDAPPDSVDFKSKDAESSPSASRIRRQAESGRGFQAAKACEPATQFRLDCNTCLCHTDGQSYSCTRYDCTAPAQDGPRGRAETTARRKRQVGEREARDCTPGSVFEQGCNVCRCAEDGQHASCTLRQCRKEDNTVTEKESDFRCSPGEQFKRACNDCACSADGKSVFCTIKLCEKEIVS